MSQSERFPTLKDFCTHREFDFYYSSGCPLEGYCQIREVRPKSEDCVEKLAEIAVNSGDEHIVYASRRLLRIAEERIMETYGE